MRAGAPNEKERGAGLFHLIVRILTLPPIVIGRMQADFTARVSLIDGTFIAQRSTRPEEESATGSTAQFTPLRKSGECMERPSTST